VVYQLLYRAEKIRERALIGVGKLRAKVVVFVLAKARPAIMSHDCRKYTVVHKR